MSFDISILAAEETFDVELIDPKTGEPLIGESGPLTVTVYGPGTKIFQAAKSAANNRAMARWRRKGKADATPEEDVAAVANFLTPCTKSFNGFGYKDAQPGPEMFRALYMDPKMGWLTDQVNREMGDWGNFTKASATS